MQGLAELEHHVVGRVDNVVDGARTCAAQPLLKPRGRRTYPHAANDRAQITQAQVRIIDPNPHLPVPDLKGVPFERQINAGIFLDLGQLYPTLTLRSELARDTDVREQIAAVRRNLDLERRIVQSDRLDERLTRCEIPVDLKNTVVLLPKA